MSGGLCSLFSNAMAELVEDLPPIPVDGGSDDDEADDLRFSKSYRETEDGALLTAKEADFREFLCDSGAANEVIRLLVGLGETSERPADPVAFLRNKFDTQDLPEMVAGKVRDDIPALLELNESLHAQANALSTELAETLATIAAQEAAAAAPLLEGLTGSFPSATEGALDVATLYAAVAAHFPPPAEPAEDAEEAPPPQPWAAEGAASPTGTVVAESLAAFAAAAFGYGAALIKAHGPELTLALLVAASGPECELDEPKASALYEACVLLVDFTEEVKPPPPEEEAE